MELGTVVGSALDNALGIEDEDDGSAMGELLSVMLCNSVGMEDTSGDVDGYVLVDALGMKLSSVSGVVLGVILGSSALIFAPPSIFGVIGCVDGFDEEICDLVGSNVGSEDGVADGSFVVTILSPKVGSGLLVALVGLGVDASNTSVGLGVKYKLVLVGSSDIVGAGLVVGFAVGSAVTVGIGLVEGKPLFMIVGARVSFCSPSTGITGASDGSSDCDGISDAQNRWSFLLP